MHARTDTAHPLDRELDIPSHWLDFGPDDPLESGRWINVCASCNADPALEFAQLRWRVRCPCGQAGTQAQLAAVAVVNWNKSPLSRHPSYRELPFFDLRDLTLPQARAKLIAVREYLEEQKRRCERRIRARENFGHRYHQRIRAYLAWAIYAQGLVKEAELALIERAQGAVVAGRAVN